MHSKEFAGNGLRKRRRPQRAADGPSTSLSDYPDRVCSERFGVEAGPAGAMTETELRQAIEQAIRRLPARQAVVAEMVWFRGMQAKAVAGVLNIMVIYDALAGPAFLPTANNPSQQAAGRPAAAAAART